MTLLSIVPLPYRILAMAVFATALFGFGYVKGLEHEKANFDAFKLEVAKEANKAQDRAIAQKAADQLRKETADHENADALAILAGTIKRLRDAKPRLEQPERIREADVRGGRRPGLQQTRARKQRG